MEDTLHQVFAHVFLVFIIFWEIIKWLWAHSLGWVLNFAAELIRSYPKITFILLILCILDSSSKGQNYRGYASALEEAREEIEELEEKIEELENEIHELQSR